MVDDTTCEHWLEFLAVGSKEVEKDGAATDDAPEAFCYTKKSPKPKYKDYMNNGKYCSYGIARQLATNADTAVCTKFMEMKYDEKVLEEPYPCNPSDQKK